MNIHESTTINAHELRNLTTKLVIKDSIVKSKTLGLKTGISIIIVVLICLAILIFLTIFCWKRRYSYSYEIDDEYSENSETVKTVHDVLNTNDSVVKTDPIELYEGYETENLYLVHPGSDFDPIEII